MNDPRPSRWLNRFAIFTALSTLALIALGGLVTSKGVGMAVPDWPTSYGYNMFWFPVSKWVGGIFYEHTHRLVATFVGILVVALTRWTVGRAACKPLLIIGAIEVVAGLILPRISPQLSGAGYFLSGIGGVVLLAGMVWVNNQTAGLPVRNLAWVAFVLVQTQGLLGGLRVVLIWDKIGIFHGALAQLFLVVLCVIALLTSRWWLDFAKTTKVEDDHWLRGWLPIVTLLIFCQLIIGATMRHEHAGLAIPDFPLAYHRIWPAMDPASVEGYNQRRLDVEGANPITAFQIKLQLAHRFTAMLILMGVGFCAWTARRQTGAGHALAKLTLGWLGLIGLQVVLGATTIWSNKAADIATAHVVVGALSLVTGALLTIAAFRVLIPTASTLPVLAPIGAMPGRRIGHSAK
jgi:cytochrome c oxidase assembly protein subunit 15